MTVIMVLTAMVNSGGSALVVFVADSSYCGGDRFEDENFIVKHYGPGKKHCVV